MDLFTRNQNKQNLPLAEKMRPQSIEDLLGQLKVFGEHGEKIEEFLDQARLPNIILWGPPGSGKTSLAHVIKNQLVNTHFVSANAIDTGAKKIKEIGEVAKRRRLEFNEVTVLFIDEIHRLNRAQQDVLLPFTEKGDFSLIGATTENPSYELNSALLSRCRVFVFKKHDLKDLEYLLLNACRMENVSLTDILDSERVQELCWAANGDGRKLLNLFESILALYRKSESGKKNKFPIKEGLKSVFESSTIYYDKKSQQHYDCVSAFIKSIRGSDPDAGLYYLSRMIEGGEDPKFIARRLIILASEDIGNADPRALQVAISGMQAVEYVGLPEAAINLAQVVTYLSSAPKSNRSYMGLKQAQNFVRSTGNLDVPAYLKSSLKNDKKMGVTNESYSYPHSEAKPWVNQDYLPKLARGEKFYIPSQIGFEKQIQAYLDWLKSKPANKKE